MDNASKAFLTEHKDKLGGRVLEIGSLNVNGSVREVIDVAVGVDMRHGRGVDIVCDVAKLVGYFPVESFDACVSVGTLEHVKDWQGFILTTWDMVKEGGYLVMTMASMDKGRHSYPDDYWRFTEDQIRGIYPKAEWVGNFAKPGKMKSVSIGWVVKKEGELGSLDFEPIKVK